MSKNIIFTRNAPAPIGPYSQATSVNNLIYTAGQIPIDPKTGELSQGGIKDQTRLVLENLKAVVQEGGSSLSNVLKTTVFLKDMSQFSDMNEVYGEYFDADSAPARSAVEVARLPKDVLVEIEAVAFI